jgi:sporulation protein YhbH
MAEDPSSFIEPEDGEKRWYDLFSRGARDWLRHNDKVSDAVRKQLPELISKIDVLGPKGASTLRVPVRFLEHYRFRLRDDDTASGVGQGQGKPGDTLAKPTPGAGGEKGAGGDSEGGYEFVLELRIDDIVDWLWEELKLPHLKRKEGRVEDRDFTREGWNRRGVRSRLDRRRSVREAIKRRAMHADAPPFTDEDLRFRQLVMRKQPTTEAVVFFAMDVSSSMTEEDRRLAKTFFFWVVQGLRRQYTHIEPVFIAHTVEAWEFSEDEFFQVAGSGGTVASTAFEKAQEIIKQRFDAGRYNIYLFYASDGANFPHDADNASAALHALGKLANFEGYIEVQSGSHTTERSEMGRIFDSLASEGASAGSYMLTDADTVWSAIRAFFTEQSARPSAKP